MCALWNARTLASRHIGSKRGEENVAMTTREIIGLISYPVDFVSSVQCLAGLRRL